MLPSGDEVPLPNLPTIDLSRAAAWRTRRDAKNWLYFWSGYTDVNGDEVIKDLAAQYQVINLDLLKAPSRLIRESSW